MKNRIFKTILIMTLCLGITLPANAGGTDVSDGSAFITKSEMAYQLNNLSSRMTLLENSLDSKIDTLVSSYLTRNGIWNGAKQNILIGTALATGEHQYQGYNTSGGNRQTPRHNPDLPSFADWWYKNIYWYNDDGTRNSTGMLVYATSGDYYDYDLIFTSSKSGLCNFKKHYAAVDVQNRLGFLAAFNSEKRADASWATFGQFFPNFGVDDVLYVGNDSTKTEVARLRVGSVDIGKVSYYNNIRDGLGGSWDLKLYDVGMVNMLTGQQQFYFFINKGDSFYTRTEFFWQCASSILAQLFQNSSDVLMFAGEKNNYYLYTISASVY